MPSRWCSSRDPAAEEYGHVEVVAMTINAMLTGTDGTDVVATGNPHHVLKGGKGALPVDSTGAPWNGDYVFSSGWSTIRPPAR